MPYLGQANEAVGSLFIEYMAKFLGNTGQKP
jgi:ABC-type sugar transport system substrate-binding protein